MRQRGEAARFEAVFVEHWTPVYRVLLRLVGDPAEAEDLALETFWRLHQRPPANVVDLNLGGWLYRVATNLGLNALRSRKRRERYELQAGQWENASPVDPLDAVAAGEECERVRVVLGEMEERQAQLLVLRHSGLAYAEVADALGIAPGSVGTLLARAEREFERRYRGKGE